MKPSIVLNRRDFLRTAGVAGATVALGKLPWADLIAAETRSATVPPPSWVDKTVRSSPTGRDLHITVPSILDHEVVAIDL